MALSLNVSSAAAYFWHLCPGVLVLQRDRRVTSTVTGTIMDLSRARSPKKVVIGVVNLTLGDENRVVNRELSLFR